MAKISEERLTTIIDGGDFPTRQESEILAKSYRKRKYGKKWVEWTGGLCPVYHGTLIDVRFRGDALCDLFSVPALDHDTLTTHDYWRNDGSPHDIVAYRHA